MSEKRKKRIVREMRAIIETDVTAGFGTPAQIVEGVVYAYSDDLPAETLRPIAEKLVAKAMQKHLEAQAEWPEVTDNDRLDAAFAELEQHDILARQNYSDCITGGHDEMQKEVARAREQGREIRGYTFFHMQDTDHVVKTGILHLAYGTRPATDEEVALAYLRQLLENEDAPLPAELEQPVQFKQAVIEKLREKDPAFPVPSTVAEALRVLQGVVKNIPLLERLGLMSTVPKNELAVFKVANEILDTLRRHGLDATWDGLSERRIEVRLDWKRRRSPNPAGSDDVSLTGQQAEPDQHDAGNDETGHHDQEGANADGTKTAELFLPYLYPVEDMHHCLNDCPSDLDALTALAKDMDWAGNMLRAVKDAIAGHEVSISTEDDAILVRGPAAVIDELIGKGHLEKWPRTDEAEEAPKDDNAVSAAEHDQHDAGLCLGGCWLPNSG